MVVKKAYTPLDHRRLSTSVLHHTTDVRLALDTGPITPLLRKCGALDASDDIAQVRQFSHGQSNPTYILESSAGARLCVWRVSEVGAGPRGRRWGRAAAGAGFWPSQVS